MREIEFNGLLFRRHTNGYYYHSHPPNYRLYVLHRYTWEYFNGEIPKGHIVLFIDKNRNNCDISNLKCVHQSELNGSKFKYMNYRLKDSIKSERIKKKYNIVE